MRRDEKRREEAEELEGKFRETRGNDRKFILPFLISKKTILPVSFNFVQFRFSYSVFSLFFSRHFERRRKTERKTEQRETQVKPSDK